ncbi:MAG: beta-ketoacyl synthase N-terminal-like domain-containing protein [Acidobacteriota bacterium]
MNKIVVTGMGILCSIASSIKEFTIALRTGKNGIRFCQEAYRNIGAELVDFQFIQALEKMSLDANLRKRAQICARRSPPSVQAAAICALEAWQQAQLSQQIEASRIGLVVAGQNINQNYQYQMQEKFQQHSDYLPPSYALHFMDTDHVGTLSEIFSIQGEGFTVGGASASGNVAIIQGYRLLQCGVVDVCLVVGAMADLSPVEFQAFTALGAMGGKRFGKIPEQACRPFDRNCEGFIYGQGSGCLILETQESANARNAEIVAQIAGGALVLDGNRLADPSQEGEAKAMSAAMQQSGIKPTEVNYINAHGTASPLGDRTEIAAIKNLFGNGVKKIWINSSKSLIGHCLYASGVVEAIATIVQMCNGFVHPNLNLDQPIDTDCRFVSRSSETAEIIVALSNSFGFGGINSSLVLRREKLWK